jgi:AcrR family transcriptional regulator
MMRKKASAARGGPGRLSAQDAAKLSDRGFADSTMEQVARQAGASTKTLYARYGDKAELLQAVINRIMERSLATVEAVAPLDPRRTDPRSFVIAFGTRMATSISKEAAGLVRIALSEARRFPAIARNYNATLAWGRGIFEAALTQWGADGLLPELGNPERAAILLVSMLSDMGRIRTAMGEPMSDAEIAAFIPYATDMFLRGCGYKPKK